MRKVVVWGFVVVSAAFLFTGAQAQRIAPIQQVPPSQDKPAQQVEVVNFPAVQQVGGAVNVGNLPVDGDGNLRVAALPAGPTFRWIKIADAVAIGDGQHLSFDPVEIGGWRRYQFYVRLVGLVDTGNQFCANLYGYVGGEDFQTLLPPLNGYNLCFNTAGQTEVRVLPDEVRGPLFRLEVITPTGVNGHATLDAWMYLSN